MKVNQLERLIVNSPLRVLVQKEIILRWIKRKLELPAGGVFLEIGCGRGAGARLLLKQFSPAVIYAMDVDMDMVFRARAYLTPAEKKRINLYVGDALDLPHRNSWADAVFGFGVLHHLQDWRPALAEISRVLKPGGFYFLEEFYPPFYLNSLARRLLTHPEEDRFYSQDLHEALANAGLIVRDALEIRRWGILAICRKTPV